VILGFAHRELTAGNVAAAKKALSLVKADSLQGERDSLAGGIRKAEEWAKQNPKGLAPIKAAALSREQKKMALCRALLESTANDDIHKDLEGTIRAASAQPRLGDILTSTYRIVCEMARFLRVVQDLDTPKP
jgi:hypothetical protein